MGCGRFNTYPARGRRTVGAADAGRNAAFCAHAQAASRAARVGVPRSVDSALYHDGCRVLSRVCIRRVARAARARADVLRFAAGDEFLLVNSILLA